MWEVVLGMRLGILIGGGVCFYRMSRWVLPIQIQKAECRARSQTRDDIIEQYRERLEPIFPELCEKMKNISNDMETGVLDLMDRLEQLADQAAQKAKETIKQFNNQTNELEGEGNHPAF